MVYYDQKKYEDALNYYNKAIKINPNYADAYNGIGNCKFHIFYLLLTL